MEWIEKKHDFLRTKFWTEKFVDLRMDFSLTTALTILTLTIVIKLYFIDVFRRNPRWQKFADTLPGPAAWPVIGNGYDFWVNGSDNILNLLRQYGKKYGPTYRLWLGNRLMVSLADIDDLQTVLNHPNTINQSEALQPYIDYFDGSIFAFKNEVWRRSRKLLQPVFSKQMVKTHIPVISGVVSRYIDILEQHIDGSEFNMLEYLSDFAVDAFLKAYFSLEMDATEKNYYKFHEILKEVDTITMPRVFMPILQCRRFADLLHGRRLRRIADKLKHFTKKVVGENESLIDEKLCDKCDDLGAKLSQRTLAAAVCELRKRAGFKSPAYSDLNNISTSVIDTGHSMPATICSLLLVVAAKPEIQEKLYNEMHDVFGDDDRLASYDDILKLPYLERVLKETQRRFTTNPFIFRNVEADTQIGARLFPKGTQLVLRIVDVHLNPQWYPNPLEFNPQNFAPDAVAKRSKYTFLAFSGGVRDCVAKNYVEIAIKLTLIELLRHYKFYTSMKWENMNNVATFTAHLQEEYKLRIERRQKLPFKRISSDE